MEVKLHLTWSKVWGPRWDAAMLGRRCALRGELREANQHPGGFFF